MNKVTIVDFKVRENNDGDPFIALIVQGGLEMVKSKETGMFYATAKKASIPSTFNEEAAKQFIGEQIEGSVQKIECEPYEYTIEDTGEVIELSHRWVFVKEGETVEEAVKQEQHQEEPELV